MKQVDVAQVTLNAIKFEENESSSRQMEDDATLFFKKCDKIREKLKDVKQLKEKGDNSEKLSSLRQEVCMLFLDLKKINRLDKFRCKQARDEVSKTKANVDFKHLQLQNLLYEAMYLQKEISKCLEFRSKDEDIDLIPIDKFYTEAPERISNPAETNGDAHKLQLARLQWELTDRKNLAKALEEKTAMKEDISEGILQERQCLENLKPMLKQVVEATQPLHKQLDLPLQSTDVRHANAEFLPRALYILYVNACAAKEAYHDSFDVEMEGNVEEAKSLQENPIVEDEDDGVDSDNEDRKAKRHRKSLTDKKDAALKRITLAHPLTVILTFFNKEFSAKLRIEFSFMITLRIITVKVRVESPTELKHTEILDESLLKYLFPDDDGESSPNPGNAYYLQLHGLQGFSFLTEKIGYPFLWAQKFGGLHFLHSTDASGSSASLVEFRTDDIVSNMDKTIIAIRKRFRSRLLLDQQFSELERGMLSLPPNTSRNCFSKLSCAIKEWTLSNWEQVKNHPCSEELLNIAFLHDNCFVHKLTLERGSAQLKACVVIPYDYPTKTPVFLLTLNWHTEKTSKSDYSLRELEELVNCRIISNVVSTEKEPTLLFQVHNLCVGFDVLLESEESSSGVEGPLEFPQGRVFLRMKSGRDHAKPYRYSQQFGFFTD